MSVSCSAHVPRTVQTFRFTQLPEMVTDSPPPPVPPRTGPAPRSSLQRSENQSSTKYIDCQCACLIISVATLPSSGLFQLMHVPIIFRSTSDLGPKAHGSESSVPDMQQSQQDSSTYVPVSRAPLPPVTTEPVPNHSGVCVFVCV